MGTQYSSVPNSSACTFINFEEKIHPARPYLGLHVYLFWEKFPPCMFIPPYTFIEFYYFSLLCLFCRQNRATNCYLLTFIFHSFMYSSCQIIFLYIYIKIHAILSVIIFNPLLTKKFGSQVYLWIPCNMAVILRPF